MASEFLNYPLAHAVGWSVVTIALYWLSKKLYTKWPRWWLMPLIIAPVLVGTVILALHSNYREYIRGTHWLITVLGPVTVAFAIPIYESRGLIRSHWPVLLVGMVVGSATAILSTWGLSSLLHLDDQLRLSLLPRSLSTPFAMEVSTDIGGAPELTTVFVILTGVFCSLRGDLLLAQVGFASAMARGALFGMGAHATGTARAHQIGHVEGTISGLIMVLVGLMNIVLAPLISHLIS